MAFAVVHHNNEKLYRYVRLGTPYKDVILDDAFSGE